MASVIIKSRIVL